LKANALQIVDNILMLNCLVFFDPIVLAGSKKKLVECNDSFFWQNFSFSSVVLFVKFLCLSFCVYLLPYMVTKGV